MGPGARQALRLAGHLCRLLLAAVFLTAGLLKALDPEGFAREVSSYGILAGSAATVFAYLLIPVEVAVGSALLVNFRAVSSLGIASALMLLFIGAISFALITDQPLEACGCFGRNMPRTPQQTLAEDVGFLAAGLFGVFALRSGAAAGPVIASASRWKAPALAATALASTAFVIASPHLPIDDVATALRPGVTWESLGVALAETDLSKGNHLVVIMGMKEASTAAALPQLNSLAATGRVPLVGLYADDDSAYGQFFWTHGPAFPLYHVSPPDLGRMHRRLPRLFALRSGVVTATWEQMPDEGQIREALQ